MSINKLKYRLQLYTFNHVWMKVVPINFFRYMIICSKKLPISFSKHGNNLNFFIIYWKYCINKNTFKCSFLSFIFGWLFLSTTRPFLGIINQFSSWNFYYTKQIWIELFYCTQEYYSEYSSSNQPSYLHPLT